MYEYMTDPRWEDLDEKTKQAVISASFDEDIGSDPRWKDIPKEKQRAVWNAYLDEAGQKDLIASAPADRGFIGDVVSRLARGGVGLLEGVSGAMRMSDLDPGKDEGIISGAGKSLSDWAGEARKKYDILKPDIAEVTGQEGIVKRGFGSAVESTIPSLAPLAGGYAGMKAGALIGGGATLNPAGAIIGGTIGFVLGAGATLFGTFGLGEYQNAYDEAKKSLKKQGIGGVELEQKAEKHALTSATAEYGGELIGDVAGLTFFGILGKKVVGQSVKQTIRQIIGEQGFIKALAKTAPFEVGSEMGTAYYQAKSQLEAGISKADPREAMAEAVLPAMFMSLIFGAGVRGLQLKEAHNLYTSLNSSEIPDRKQAVNFIGGRLDKNEAKLWFDTANDYIKSGEPIPLNKPIIDFAVQKADMPIAAKVKPVPKLAEDDTGILQSRNVDEAVERLDKSLEPTEDQEPTVLTVPDLVGADETTFNRVVAGVPTPIIDPVAETRKNIVNLEQHLEKNVAYKGTPMYKTWENALLVERAKLPVEPGGAETQIPIQSHQQKLGALSPEFFADIQTAVTSGQDKQGNAFAIDDAQAMLDEYMNKPSANLASAKQFIGLVSQLRKEQEDASRLRENERQVLPGEAPPLEANAQREGIVGGIAEENVRQQSEKGGQNLEFEQQGQPGGAERLATKKTEPTLEPDQPITYQSKDQTLPGTLISKGEKWATIEKEDGTKAIIPASKVFAVETDAETKEATEPITEPLPERETLAKRIADASKEPVPDIAPVVELLGSDGQWRSPLAFPKGVTSTGEKRIAGYAYRNRDGQKFGQQGESEDALRERWVKGQTKKADEFYNELLTMPEARLKSQAEYWLKEPMAETLPKEAPVKKPRQRALMSAGRISDFRQGIDLVERRGERTFVVDKEGQRAPVEVSSDKITPEVEANIRKTPTDKLQEYRTIIVQTPYLSAEGKSERIMIFDEVTNNIVLAVIKNKPDVTFSEIEQETKIAPGRIGGALRRLKEKGFIAEKESKMSPGGLTPSSYKFVSGALKDYPELTKEPVATLGPVGLLLSKAKDSTGGWMDIETPVLSIGTPRNVKGQTSMGDWGVDYEIPSTLGKTGKQTRTEYFWRKTDAHNWISDISGLEKQEVATPAPSEQAGEVKPGRRATGAENLITYIISKGGINLGEDYSDTFRGKFMKPGKNRELEFPDVRRVANSKTGKPIDEMVADLNSEGFNIKSADNLMELLRTGQARNIFTPAKSDTIIERRLRSEEYEWAEQQLGNYYEQERIDAGAAKQSQVDLKDSIIDEIRAEGVIDPAKEDAALKEIEDFFEEVSRPKASILQEIIPYSKSLDIRNLDAMPRGTGARYLLALQDNEGALIAKQWKRTLAPPSRGEVLVDFKPEQIADLPSISYAETFGLANPEIPKSMGEWKPTKEYTKSEDAFGETPKSEETRPLYGKINELTTSQTALPTFDRKLPSPARAIKEGAGEIPAARRANRRPAATTQEVIDNYRQDIQEAIKTDKAIDADDYDNVTLARDVARIEKQIKAGQPVPEALAALRSEIQKDIETDKAIDADSYGNWKRLDLVNRIEKNFNELATGKPTRTVLYSIAEKPPAFYSKLAQAIESKSFTKMPASQLKSMLKGMQVTDDEIENVLGGLEGMVTKQQVSDAVKMNTTEFRDVMLGGALVRTPEIIREEMRFADRRGDWQEVDRLEREYEAAREKKAFGDTKFGDVTSKGAEGGIPGTYRELTVTMPKNEMPDLSKEWDIMKAALKVDDNLGFDSTTDAWEAIRAHSDYLDRWEHSPDTAKAVADYKAKYENRAEINWRDQHSQYSDIANPVIRIHFDDRSVEPTMKVQYNDARGTWAVIQDGKEVDAFESKAMAESEADYIKTGDRKRILFIREMQSIDKVKPDSMPQWVWDRAYDIGVKRILAYAKENGYDGVSWPTGQIVADRYDLAKLIDRLQYIKNKRGRGFTLAAFRSNKLIEELTPKTADISDAELENFVGKELAKKIRQHEGADLTNDYDSDDVYFAGELSGLDLEIGGEGIKDTYDRRLPGLFKKYGKEGVSTIKLTTPQLGTGRTVREIAQELYGTQNIQSLSEAQATEVNRIARESEANAMPSFPYVPITDKTPGSYPQYAAQPAEQKALPVRTISMIQAVFPGQKVEKQGNEYVVATKGGLTVHVEIVPEIVPETGALEKGYGKSQLQGGEYITGLYVRDKANPETTGRIKLVMLGGNPALHHESIHFLEDFGIITKSEQSMIDRQIKRGGKWIEKLSVAENRANWFADELNAPGPTTMTGRIWAKIKDFVNRLVNYFGHRTAAGVVREVKSGEIFGKPMAALREKTDLGNKYAAREDAGGLVRAETDESAYLDAVNRGDMESAQKIVDEAAKKWQAYDTFVSPRKKLYHGTTEEFTVFDVNAEMSNIGPDSGVGFMFSDRRSTALSAARRFARSQEGTNAGRVVTAYLKIKNPMEFDGQEEWFNYVRGFASSEDVRNDIRDSGNDGVVIWNADVDRGVEKEATEHWWVALDPNQIKLADPVTYDNEGNIVPLSERFNEYTPDIRYAVNPYETTPEAVGEIYNKRAIKKYGLAAADESIGYITREGRGIDSSGIRQGSVSQGRNVDHREIAQHALGDDSVEGFSANMQIFMNETGDIRVVDAKGALNIDVPLKHGMPSAEQISKIKELATGKKMFWDFTDEKGNPVKSGEGRYSNFFESLQSTIKSENEIKVSRESGSISKQLQPLIDFIKKNNLSREKFLDSRHNKDNPLFAEHRKQMDKTGIGVNKMWRDFGITSEGEFYDRVMQLPDPSRPPDDVRYSVNNIINSDAKYEKKELADPPGVDADPITVKEWLADTTDAILQTAASKLPSNLPAMSFIEKALKSPEYYDHPALNRIVRFFARDRNEIYHEYLNHLLQLDDPNMTENTVNELAKDLRGKGLAIGQRLTGKASKEYKDLGRIIDEGDTSWKRDTSKPLDAQIKAYEDNVRKQGVSEEVIKIWRYYRESYDRALDLMTEQMKKMIFQIEEEAAFKEVAPADYSEMYMTLKGALANMETWKGFYAPRQRRGDWAVIASRKKADGTTETYRGHEWSQIKARKIANQMERAGWIVKPVTELQRLPEDIYQDVKTVNLAKMIESSLEKMKEGKFGANMAEQSVHLNEAVLHEVADMLRMRGFRSSMIHRQAGENVTKGYVEDPIERHLIYTNNVARGLAKAQVARAAYEQLFGTYLNGRHMGGIDPVKESRVFTTAEDYIREQLRNLDASDRAIGWAKSLVTLKFLGFNARSLLVNTSSMVTTAPSAIHEYAMGGKGSLLKIGRYLSVAGKDYAKFMAGKLKATPEEMAFLNEEQRLGWDDPQYTRDAQAIVNSIQNVMWNKLMSTSMWGFGVTEQWNRGTTMLAAYRLARKNNVDHVAAMELAKTASDRAHGIYGRATLPAVAWGSNPAAKVAQMMYTYSKFSHNYLQMLYEIGVKRRNAKAVIYGLMAPIILGGLTSVPFKDQTLIPLLTAIAVAAGLLDKDEDLEKAFWKWTRSLLGEPVEIAGRYGVMGSMGLDISGSLSIGVGIPKDWTEVMGPIGGALKEVGYAAEELKVGNVGRAAEHALPSGFANILRAYRESREGVTTAGRKGRIWDERGKPLRPTTSETARRALGFRSPRHASLTERLWEGKRQAANYEKRRDDIYERYRVYIAQPKKDMKELRLIWKEAQDYNKTLNKLRLSNEIPLITLASMRKQIKGMQQAPNRQREMLRH